MHRNSRELVFRACKGHCGYEVGWASDLEEIKKELRCVCLQRCTCSNTKLFINPRDITSTFQWDSRANIQEVVCYPSPREASRCQNLPRSTYRCRRVQQMEKFRIKEADNISAYENFQPWWNPWSDSSLQVLNLKRLFQVKFNSPFKPKKNFVLVLNCLQNARHSLASAVVFQNVVSKIF